MATEDKMIVLGNCGKPHGIKGGFLFNLFNTKDSILKAGNKILLRPTDSTSSIKDSGQTFEIAKIQFGAKTICYLKDITDRNMVEAMLPFQIEVSRKQFPKTKEGEFYVADLIGRAVKDESDFQGTIVNFYENGAQWVFVIESTDGTQLDIPFVHQFFPRFDPTQEIISIIVPEYED